MGTTGLADRRSAEWSARSERKLNRKANGSLLLGLAAPFVSVVALVLSGAVGVLISPFALIGSVVAVTLAISARRDVAHVYSLGEHVFQPLEDDLGHAHTVTAWAIGVSVPAIVFEAVLALVLAFY